MICLLDPMEVQIKDEKNCEEKNIKGKNLVTFMLKDVFRFAKQQEKATCGFAFILTLQKTKVKRFWIELPVLLLPKTKLITATGTYIFLCLLFSNKVFCLNQFKYK